MHRKNDCLHFLQHPDPLMRGLVVRLMGKIHATEVTMQLMGLAGDKEIFVVCEAGKLVEITVADAAKIALDLIREGEKNE